MSCIKISEFYVGNSIVTWWHVVAIGELPTDPGCMLWSHYGFPVMYRFMLCHKVRRTWTLRFEVRRTSKQHLGSDEVRLRFDSSSLCSIQPMKCALEPTYNHQMCSRTSRYLFGIPRATTNVTHSYFIYIFLNVYSRTWSRTSFENLNPNQT